ncbi:MAG: hypothetical protein AMXMBFR84_33400 [Candidatus Hydrogenedentota bacterium]
MKRTHFSRSQRMTIVTAILCIVSLIVILQLWLLTATMEAFLGGNQKIVIPAAIASAGCFLLNFGLLHFYLRKLEE